MMTMNVLSKRMRMNDAWLIMTGLICKAQNGKQLHGNGGI